MRGVATALTACCTVLACFGGACAAPLASVDIASATAATSAQVSPGGPAGRPGALPRGFLYRIERAGAAPSFLFGTLHSADPRVTAAADAPALARAMAATRTLAIEMQSGPGDDAQIYAAAELPQGTRLDALLDPATMTAVEHALEATTQPGAVARLKPWAVLLKLAEAPGQGGVPLDALLRERARERRMKLLGLELPEEQVAAFDAIPQESQIALMRYALEHRAEMTVDHAHAVQAWLAGDARALARVAHAPIERHPELGRHLAALERSIVTGRTALFAHRLFVPLRAGRVLVAVGASHLLGDEGLIALIEAQGYRVRAVPWPR